VEQRVVITLDAEDLQELERILMDREEKDALTFLRERVEKKVREATRVHCKPPFDG
jgi:hypothetical protein